MKRALDAASGCSRSPAAQRVTPTEHACAAEARLRAEAAAWNAPTDLESIPLATEEEMPILDLGPYFASDTVRDLEQAAATLRRAKNSTGFHYIVNHGVPLHLISRTFEPSARRAAREYGSAKGDVAAVWPARIADYHGAACRY